MHFWEMQRGVADDLQYQAQPKPGVQDRIRRYLNEGLERVLRRPRLKNLRLGTMSLISNAGQGFYGLPMILERIDYLLDLTNHRKLVFRTRDWYRHLDPALQGTGTPSVWIPEGIVPVRRAPRVQSDGYTRIYAQSSDPGDTTQIIRMHCTHWHGNEVSVQATLQGLTPVLIGYPIGVPVQITKLVLNVACAGYVHVTDDPAPVIGTSAVATIPANETMARAVGVRLHPTPSAEIAYEVEGQRVIPKMINDEDQPPFSADFHEMLICYARARFYRKDGRLQQSQLEMAEFERFALDLTAHVEYPVDYKPVAGKLSSTGTGWSNLGPHYPADRGWLSD